MLRDSYLVYPQLKQGELVGNVVARHEFWLRLPNVELSKTNSFISFDICVGHWVTNDKFDIEICLFGFGFCYTYNI